MNTPEPCDKCKNLYYNVTQEDNPSYLAECWLELRLGNLQCPQFEFEEDKVKNVRSIR